MSETISDELRQKYDDYLDSTAHNRSASRRLLEWRWLIDEIRSVYIAHGWKLLYPADAWPCMIDTISSIATGKTTQDGECYLHFYGQCCELATPDGYHPVLGSCVCGKDVIDRLINLFDLKHIAIYGEKGYPTHVYRIGRSDARNLARAVAVERGHISERQAS